VPPPVSVGAIIPSIADNVGCTAIKSQAELLTGKAQRRLHRGNDSGREDSMKSAYGSQVPRPDYELTCVEPGSPMGELMRRYWQPVCTSDELGDLPRKEKLLCEEIVVFRDSRGRVGALDPHCAHRGASLEWGRVEERGLRCCYHG